ncbi:MAG: 3'-5' exonuclease [Algoriphagus sp.]|uniref:3'-5' exonuclease n=1 Tax=Algoriphagus sp. TaxID=1872435 RepID=UPI0017B1B40B|nr:3'-5' exonuclease [Algoriphagus sp.]NVJ87123.1 3'-5' exonuclease [Algoriphagus sp.]
MSWWPFRSQTKKQDFVEEYLRLFEKPIPGIRRISQLEFVVLDTETTGLDPKNDFVISFGGIKIQGLKIRIETAQEWYPESPKEATHSAEIHGLLERENQLKAEEFSQNLLAYFGSAILVGHHLKFDLEMLQKLCLDFGLKNFSNRTIDTLELAVRLEHGPHVNWQGIPMRDYSLDALCDRYQITPDDRHTAGGDAFLTAQLFLKLLKLAERKGITTYEHLFR